MGDFEIERYRESSRWRACERRESLRESWRESLRGQERERESSRERERERELVCVRESKM